MNTKLFIYLAIMSCFFISCASTQKKTSNQQINPPVAAIEQTQLEKHGHIREDNYFWLKNRENPKVISYLTKENKYTNSIMDPHKNLQKNLFEEIKNRIKQNDSTVPYRFKDYFYYKKYEDGKEYPIFCRKKDSLESAEEVILDANIQAKEHSFFYVAKMTVSPNQEIAAYPIDTVGRRKYTIYFKNLKTGATLPDTIPDVSANIVFANDNKTVFYTKQHPETLREYQIYRHAIGSNFKDDTLIFEEKDDTYSTWLYKTKSEQFIMIISYQTLATEFRYLDANTPNGEFKVLLPRQKDHEYWADHFGDFFYMITNYNAKNFRLMKTPIDNTSLDNWTEVIPHREDVLLEDFEIFKNHLVTKERKNGLVQMHIKSWSTDKEYDVKFDDPTYYARFGDNYEFDSDLLRFEYSSLTTPKSTYDLDMLSHEKTLLKREEVLGNFDPSNYISERLFATAKDGTQIPISIVYKQGFEKNGLKPLLLYGYGSYGYSIDAYFSSSRLSLLDRGFAFAIAHIRGGQEMGRYWYEDGKLKKKKNTFLDFIACADYLVEQKYTSPDKLFALGGSAGGLLMGAIINMRPELFRGVVALVPFVDILTTMLDDSIPLTTAEYDEWGNPNLKEYYDYILSYSPYDNVEAKAYPNLLVITGLHDSQVQYWEPAKWVAKLRALKIDNNLLLLKTNMEAGHGGPSGRYQKYKEAAFYYTFLLMLSGISN